MACGHMLYTLNQNTDFGSGSTPKTAA